MRIGEHGTQVNVHTKAHADLTQRPKHKWMPHLVLFHLLSHVVHTLSHHTSSPPSPFPSPPRLSHTPHTLPSFPPSPFPSPPRLACSGHQRRTQAAFTRRDSRELRARPRQHHHRLRLPRERQPLGGAYNGWRHHATIHPCASAMATSTGAAGRGHRRLSLLLVLVRSKD